MSAGGGRCYSNDGIMVVQQPTKFTSEFIIKTNVLLFLKQQEYGLVLHSTNIAYSIKEVLNSNVLQGKVCNFV